ncbi:MAG: PHP domain-containing protein [Candidatus Krumholzibacteriota bacterium]|nr:PHP domain-containing protein [Candidatus Krumholzibacteriota bacterium]
MVYVPLHLHSINTPYSGMLRCEEIVSRAAFFKMRSIALTDRWTTYGHHEFYHLARKSDVKPVLGAEIQHPSLTGSDGLYHLTILAENNRGYANLTSLVSKHHEKNDGKYITEEEMVLHREGLIVLTGCIRGEANQAVLHGNLGREKAVVEKLVRIYGRNNLYLEIMNHNREKELFVLDKMILLSKRMNIPMVVTNNDRFLEKEQKKYYSYLRKLDGESDPDETDEHRAEYYLKKKSDLEPYFYVVESALDESGRIAERCSVELDSSSRIEFFGSADANQVLEEKCDTRFDLKFHDVDEGERGRRRKAIQQELMSAANEGMSGFLLFLDSLIDRCEKNGIRLEMIGSEILESSVANILGIVPLDPLDHGLVFESFNTARRGIPPQIELYKPFGTREKLFLILKSLLPGQEIACQVVREETSLTTIVGKLSDLFELGQELKDEIASLVSYERTNNSLHWLLDSSERIKYLYNENSSVRELLHSSFALHGRIHNFNHNSSRIVILPCDTSMCVSYMKMSDGEKYVLLDSREIEQVGGWILIVQKLHFLTAIEKCIQEVRRKPLFEKSGDHGSAESQELWDSDLLDDEATFELISSGDTAGVYLLESSGIRDLLKKIPTADFNQLVNVISLYRPGPLEGKLWRKYIENSAIEGEIPLPQRSLAPILSDTKGVLLYREQVREIMKRTSGLEGEDALFVEHALRKQEAGALLSARLMFIRGAIANEIEEQSAQGIFDFLLHNIRYTYNRAFSCSQAYITYRTAFLKAHHFDEYFTSLLNSTSDIHEKQKRYFDYLEGIQKVVFSPDINSSSLEFSSSESGIRAPLNFANTLEQSELDAILADRRENGEYRSLEEFLVRMSPQLPMSSVHGLIDSGLFDFLMINHSVMKDESLEYYEKYARAGDFFRHKHTQNRGKKGKKEGQLSFFDENDAY